MPRYLRTVLALSGLLALACTTVADADDTTPPRLYFKYRVGDDSTWIPVPSGGAADTVGTNDVLHLWACVEDDGGAYLCQITGTGSVSCAVPPSDDDPGEIKTSGYSFNKETRSSASDGESTKKSLIVVASIAIRKVCKEGTVRSGSTLKYSALGYNFNPFGLTNSGTLTLTVD